MDLSKLVAVSGLSGLYNMAGNRKNGLILENIDTGKKGFYSSRKHQFTPLESISIYTYEDTVELVNVLRSMRDKYDELPPISPKSDTADLRAYFEEILPNYDREKVYVSDIKRLIKWFNFMQERNLLEEKPEEEVAETEESTEENAEVTAENTEATPENDTKVEE